MNKRPAYCRSAHNGSGPFYLVSLGDGSWAFKDSSTGHPDDKLYAKCEDRTAPHPAAVCKTWSSYCVKAGGFRPSPGLRIRALGGGTEGRRASRFLFADPALNSVAASG